MKRMSLRRFGQVVARVIETLPERWKACLDNVVVDVEDEPDDETLRLAGFTDEEIEAGESLYGLFVPLDVSGDVLDVRDLPHRILIFKRPLEEDFPQRRELLREIRRTVIHELAHHFGYTDRDLDNDPNLEDAPWRLADDDKEP